VLSKTQLYIQKTVSTFPQSNFHNIIFEICVFLLSGLDASLVNHLGGPLSPPELKPDISLLNGNSTGGFSPGTPGSPGSFNQLQNQQQSGSSGGNIDNISPTNRSQYPPNHPLSGSKHLCSICGDRASGKHYGVYR
jgi:Zinc finger, C4 type (two domains)